MVRSEKEKAAALILTTVCIILSVVRHITAFPQLSEVAIGKDCTILARLSYSFFHASIIHCLVNCWCLLSVVFIYRISLCSLLLAYLTAILYPVDTITSLSASLLPSLATTPASSLAGSLGSTVLPAAGPTVGLSAICFCLLGQVAFQVQRKCFFHLCILSFIAFGYIAPWLCSLCSLTVAAPDNLLHLYSYVVGLLVGFLNSPYPCRRK